MSVELVFPLRARLRHVPGAAVIRCKIDIEGRTQDCAIVQETPAGYGFGAAAVKLSQSFLFHPATLNGKPVESAIVIPIKFALPGAPPPLVNQHADK